MENTVNAVAEEVVTSQNEQVETTEVKAEQVENVKSEVVTDTQVEAENQPSKDTAVSKDVQTPEENAKFAEIRRKYEADKVEAEAKAQDALIAKMYGESHGIKTVAEYEEAMAKQAERAEIERIQEETNYSEEDAKEVLEARRIRKENEQAKLEAESRQKQEEKEKQNNLEFLDFFKSENGREFDSEKDKLDVAIWQSVSNGTPLKYAYIEHELKQLKLGSKVADKNTINSESTIGSVKGDGVTDSDYISESLFDTKKSNQRWVMDNLDKINKSRLTW